MTSVNTAKTRSFPGADIRSYHDLVMMAFQLRFVESFKRQQHACVHKTAMFNSSSLFL